MALLPFPGSSPLGFGYASPLGARARSNPVSDQVMVLTNTIKHILQQGGTPYDWVSISLSHEGTAKRVGSGAIPCHDGWLRHMRRLFTGVYPEPGLRFAGIKEKDGEFARTAADTYLSRQWEIVPATRFPAWPPTSFGTFQQSPNHFGSNNHHLYQDFTWTGSWTWAAEEDFPEGYVIYVDADPDEESGIPWYPLVTINGYPFSPGTSTTITATIIMDFSIP